MTATPLVTVITVFLNAERFLAEAIASVIAQRYDNWELLLVDDGSTDRSSSIAMQYQAQLRGKVRYVEHPGHENRGISASQNLGITMARGRYIAFLDSDDVWFPEKLEQQVAILERELEAVMVYGQTLYWHSWSDDADYDDRLIQPGVEFDSVIRPPFLLLRFLGEEIPIPCPSDVMVRREAALASGGFEDSFRRIFTDQVFYAKLCLRWPVFVAGKSWFKYRKHPDSAVALMKKSKQLRKARRAYLDWLARYLENQEIANSSIKHAIRNARFRCLFPRFFQLQPHIKYRALVIKEMLSSFARRILPVAVGKFVRTHLQSKLGTRVD